MLVYAFSKLFYPKQLEIEEHKQFITESTIFTRYNATFIIKLDYEKVREEEKCNIFVLIKSASTIVISAE